MPDGFKIASAWVEVEPSDEGFEEKLRAILEKASAGAKVQARAALDTSAFDARLDDARARLDEFGGSRAEPSIHLNDENLSRSAEEARAKLDELDNRSARPDVGLDASKLDTHIDEARSKLAALGSGAARPEIKLDDADAQAKLDAIRARLAEVASKNPSLKVRADVSDAEAKAQAIEARFGRLNAVIARPKVTPQMQAAQAQIDRLQARIRELNDQKADPRVDADIAAAQARLDAVRARLEELSSKKATPKVTADIAEAQAQIVRLQARIDELNAKKANPKVDAETAEAQARIEALKRRLDELQARDVEVRVKAGSDISRTGAELDRLLAKVGALQGSGFSVSGGEGSGKNPFGFLGAMVPGPLVSTLVAGGTGLLPGVAGAGAGLGLIGGAGFLGLSGIAGAVSAGRQAQQSPGISPQQQALTNFTNAVAVQGAQQQVGNARQQAAQDAITSAQSIESAQMNLASVERSAAEQQVQALEAVKTAQQGVEQANYALSQAQYNLNQAWESAREQIVQLNDQLQDQKLSVQSAQLAVQQAEVQQRQVDENAFSTALDKQRAALAVAQAQQQLKDSQDQLTSATYKANQANKDGVAGSQTVLQAKQGLIEAQNQQTNAQFQYADAQRQLKLTELNNAAQIKAAHMQLAAAEEQAAFQRQQDAQNIANAQRNLTNTLKEQKLQQAATAASANQAATQFQQDMAKLTPAARAVVNQVLGMKGAFDGLERAAQNGIAPGVSIFLKGLSASMPAITSGIGKVAGVLGGAFGTIGKALSSTGGAQILQGLIANGVKFAQIVVPAITRFAGALAEVGSKKGAVDGIANLIGEIADGLSGGLKALAPFAGVLSSAFTSIGGLLAPLGPLIGTIVGSLGSALAPVLKALLPAVKTLADSLGKGLASALQAIGPMLQPVGEAVNILVQAFSPFLPILGQIIGKVAQDLTPLFQALLPIIQQLANLMAQQLQSGLIDTLNAILPILPVAVQLVDSLLPIIGVVIKLQGTFMQLQTAIVGPIIGAIAWLVKEILNLAAHWQTAVGWIETAASFLWHNVFDPLWQALQLGVQGFVSAFSSAWNGLETVFKTPVNFLIRFVYKDGIEKLWNSVVGAVGASALKLPDIPMLAGGGVIPGYAPGKDTVPAMLSPGEGVLVPEAVQALGPGTVNALNAQFGGGRVSKGGHFSGGGIISTIGSAIGSVFTGGSEVVKIAAAILTGNSTALSNALDKLVGTNAVGNFGKLMLDVPTKLISTAVHALMSFFSGGSGSGISTPLGGSIPSGQHLAIIDAALAAAGVPPPGTKAQWEAGLNTLIMRESSWNPNAINLTDSNAAMGDPSRGLAQTIMSTFLAHHVPGTSMNIYDPVANVAAAIRYIIGRYGNITNVQQANASLPPKGYDSGGLASGIGMLPKYTLRPERVLSPRQTEAFERLVAVLDRQSGPGSGLGRGVQVVQNFNGSMMPNPEQAAAMRRELALALA